MKLTALVVLFYMLSAGKNEDLPDKPDGIGRFKVGQATLNLVQAIATETHMPLETVTTTTQLERLANSQIVEIKSHPVLGKSSPHPFNAPLCAHVRVFYLTNYREADIDLKSVYLYFEDELLVKFTCYATSKLNSALESRYGQPEATIVKLYSDCDYDAKSFILTWPNDNVAATLSLLVSYDNNCQKRVSQEFSITLKESQLARCESLARGTNK